MLGFIQVLVLKIRQKKLNCFTQNTLVLEEDKLGYESLFYIQIVNKYYLKERWMMLLNDKKVQTITIVKAVMTIQFQNVGV